MFCNFVDFISVKTILIENKNQFLALLNYVVFFNAMTVVAPPTVTYYQGQDNVLDFFVFIF